MQTGVLFVLAVLVLCAVLLAQLYGRTWLQAYMSNATISFRNLVGMSLRRVKIGTVVKARVMLVQAGLNQADKAVKISELEAQFLAGGDIDNVVRAMIVASRSGMSLDFGRAAAIDLAGRDVLAAVQRSVIPRVIVCPDPERSSRSALSAVAKDGVELRIQARVTVRTNLTALIGGATEETIIARVGEGITSAVGSATTHTEVLCMPSKISELLVRQGLDANTAYEIVSIDIARIDVGENIGARIRTDQAEADMRVSQALSEGRRAEAVATQQEKRALIKQRKAELVGAQSLVPMALGAAVRIGRVGCSKGLGRSRPSRSVW